MEKWMNRPAWVEVDLGKLDSNIKIVLSRVVPGVKVLGVVKADAYGHGMKEVYKVMKENGIDDYGVATLQEAVDLREYCDPKDRIVVFSLISEINVEEVCKYNAVTLIENLNYAKALSEEAQKQGVTIEVMGCVDTGMGRIGYQWDDPACVEEIFEASEYPNLEMIGVFSHLSSEDVEYKYWSDLQYERFLSVIAGLEAKGLTMPLNSLANSPATCHRPHLQFGLVRPGGVFFGRYEGTCVAMPGVQNILSVKANITQLKDVPDNFSVGYERVGRTNRPSKIATLALGFADGLIRSWGNGNGHVIVNGHFAPTIGKMCMDQFMVDVTDVPDVKVGDEVTIIGESGGLHIYPEEFAAKCNSATNELTCGLPVRLPYKYIR